MGRFSIFHFRPLSISHSPGQVYHLFVRISRVVLTIVAALALTGTGAGAQQKDSVAAPVLPDTMRGLYVNRWAALAPRMWQLIALAKTTEVNALVIDEIGRAHV